MEKQIPVIIPAYEPDEKMIRLLQTLQESGIERIVVVDDGSGKEYRNLFEQAKQLGAIVLTHAVNLGKGRALKTAFNEVLNRYPEAIGAITADSDGQHTPACIQKCMEAMEKEPEKGERFEFETYMLLEAGEQKVGIREVPIETVYLNDNKGSHFNPLLDSARIYLVFAKFLFSSLSSCIIDLVLFALFCSLTKERMPEAVSYIVVSTVLARVVSAGYNFFLNYRVVFKSSGAVWKSAVRYFVLAVVQMLASAGLVSLLYGVLGGSEVAVKILVDVFLFFISFLIQREIVYR